MQYASMSAYENTTPKAAREFIEKLVNLRLFAGGPIYVCPMGQVPIEGELPLLESLTSIGGETPINAYILQGKTFLNVASLIRHYGKGTLVEYKHLASSFSISELDAYQRIPEFAETIAKLIKKA